MKRYLLTLCALLMAVPAFGQQPLVSGVTTREVTFVLYDSDNAVVTGATVSSVIRRRGNGDDTAMTTPTVAEEGNGFYSLLVDEDTTITSGLARETMVFRINMSAGEPVFVLAVLEAPQATLADIITAIFSKQFWESSDNGDIKKTWSETDPTPSSDPTRYSDRGANDGEEAAP